MMMENWFQQLRGDTVVVKFGGNAMISDALARAFCEDIVALRDAGIRVVVTHGGGPQISSELVAQGIPSEFRGGLRVTSAAAVDVVREVLARIGAELAAHVTAAGGVATAIAGAEQGLFTARKTGTVVNGEPVDLGQVGEVTSVTANPVDAVLDAGGIPVVSAIAREGASGILLNVNADSAAGALAAALGARWLVLLTDVSGLYRNWPRNPSLITAIDVREVEALLPQLDSGMIPKVTAARDAVLGGVSRVAIVDGRVPHLLVSEPFGASGTIVSAAERTAP